MTTAYYFAGSARVAMRQGGVVSYIHGDHLGSASLTTNSSGGKVGELRYKPYGETRYVWGSTPTDRRFTGQRSQEASLGSLYDYGARFMSPVLGRFLSADTIVPSPGNPQDLNRYAYTRGNPLRFTDPTGHYAFEEDPDDPWSYGTNVRSEHYYTHPDYRAGNQSDAQFLAGAAAPIWVPAVAMAGAEEIGELAYIAHWGIRKIVELIVGGACADGDCTNEATAGTKTATEYLGNVYRNATGKPDSLTPRLEQDVLTPLKDGEIPGLSTFTSLDKLNPGKYVVIDTTKLINLQAMLDDPAKGHVTITSGNLPELLQWSLTRGTTVAMDLAHRFTQEVYQAITFTGKK